MDILLNGLLLLLASERDLIAYAANMTVRFMKEATSYLLRANFMWEKAFDCFGKMLLRVKFSNRTDDTAVQTDATCESVQPVPGVGVRLSLD